jgi:pilus assembly protein CpaE
MASANRIRAVVWKPLVICPQPDLQRRLGAVLDGMAIEQPCTLAAYPEEGGIPAILQRHGCNLCFVDAATDGCRAESVVGEAAPLVPVVVLHPRNDAGLILRCLRKGASEFVEDPAGETLTGVFERLARTRYDGAEQSPGFVYCVVPGKPGCGASTIAAHLAIQMRADGINPVLLVDGDHLTASIAFMLRLKVEFHLEDVLKDWARMDEDVWSRLIVQAHGIDVLAAPEDPTTHTMVSKQFATELCAYWRERYEGVVIDMPDVRVAVDCGFAAQSDAVLLVTTNELAVLQAAGRCLRYLDSGLIDRGKLRLVLNRFAPANGLPSDDVKTALAIEPFAILHNDYEAIQTALLNGRPVAANTRFGASLQHLSRALTHKGAPAQKNPSWLSGLLGRKPVAKP